MESSESKILNKFKKIKANFTVFFFEVLYRIHIRIRLLHDKVYQRGGTYKRYSDSPISSYIHRASMLAFVFSFIVFQFMQNIWPYMFTFKPREVQAGQNSVTWTTKNDFESNASTTNDGTSISQLDTSSSTGNVKLSPTVDPSDGSDGSLTVDYSTGTTGDYTVSGQTATVNIIKSAVSSTSSAGQAVLNVSSTTGFSAGQKVFIIQMLGTGIGNQEEATISSVGAGTLTMTLNLTNTYTNDASSKAQALKINQYTNLTVTNNTTLTVAAWDSTSGGVLPIKASGTVQIDSGSIVDLSGKGYAGGAGGAGEWSSGSSGEGPGAGGAGTPRKGAGGGAYGGNGGNGRDGNTIDPSGGAPGGSSYTSFLNLGSGGGGGGTEYSGNNGGSGGAGGGAIKIQAGNIVISGNIYSRGITGGSSSGSNRLPSGAPGGGAGGAIHLISLSSFANADKVQANGGNSGEGSYNGGGGGGGGRVKIDALSITPILNADAVTPGGSAVGIYGGVSGSSGVYSPVTFTPYVTSGTIGGSGGSDVGLRKDVGTGLKAKWSNIAFNSTALASGQAVKFAVRTSDDGTTWSALKGRDGNAIDWTTGTGNYLGQAYGESVYSSITGISPTRFIDMVVRLESSGADTPTLNDVTLTYNTLDTPSSLKQFDSEKEISASSSNNYTNNSNVTLKATVNGFDNPSTLTPEFEVRTTDSGWTGSPATPGGVTATPSDVNYSGSQIADAAVGTLSGLSAGNTYYWKIRLTDGAGRVSAWSLAQNFSVEQTPPTVGSFTLNSDATYANSSTRVITANGIFNDTGGSSGTLNVQFSEDGTNWGVYSGSGTTNNKATDWTYSTNVTASGSSQNITNTWYLEGSDGSKTVYVRTKDAAGNVSTGPVTDSITLDMASPAAFELSSPASNTWQTSATPTLSWNASSDANGLAKYQLFIDGNLDTDNISNASTSQAVTNALLVGNHTWYIKAVDNAGNITQSTSTWNIGYDATNPSLALDPGFTFSATDTNNTSVTVIWNTYADDSGTGAPADYYNIERLKNADYLLGSHTLTSDWSLGGDGAGSGYYGGYGNKTTTSQTDNVGANPEDLEASVKYIYRVKITDKAGNVSAWLRSDTGLTADVQKPTDPSSVTATPCDGTAPNCSDVANKGYEIKLAWTASTDTGTGITGYKIYRRAEANSTIPTDFTIVGYLDVDPPGAPVSTVWYDNDVNNDTTFTDTINEVPDTSIKGSATARLNDYVDYYYRIVAIDSAGNQTDVVTLDAAPPYTANNTNFAATKTVDITASSVPADLTPTAMGIDDLGGEPATQQVDVSWTASTDARTSGRIPAGNGSGVKEYKLYRAIGDINGPTAGFVLVTTTSSINYTDKGLAEFTYYYYKVLSVDNSDNQSSQSSQSFARTLSSQVPTTPSSVTVTSLKGNPNTDANVGSRMTVTFNGSKIKYGTNTITGYQAYRSTTNHAASSDWLDPAKATLVETFENLNVAGDTQDGQRSFTEDAPSDTTTYYYKVRAVGNNPDLGGVVNSGLSTISPGTLNTGWDTTPDSTEPTTPLEVKVKDIHGDGSTMLRNIVTWQRIPDSDSQNKRGGNGDFKEYRVYRYTDTVNKSDLTLIATKTTLSDNYHVDGIAQADANNLYYYYVVAVDNAAMEFKYANGTVINSYANISSYQDAVSINPAAAKPVVNAASISVTNVGVSTATVNWNTDQNADSVVEYRVKGVNSVIGTLKDRTTPTASHSVDIKALNKGTTYEYRIVSRNALGNIDETAANTWREFTTQDFAITSTDVITTTTTATVRWNTNIDSDSNAEFKKEARAGEATEDSQTAGDPKMVKNHEVVIKALKPDTNYTYKIRSVTGDNFISETQFLTFKTKPYDASQFVISPNASSIAEQNITATSAKITWNTAVTTTSWLDYGTSSSNYTMAAGNDNYSTVHVVELVNLTPGTTYFYKVRGKDTNDIEYTSQEYSFTAVLLPQILNPKTSGLTSYNISIDWETNVSATSFVAFGKDTTYGSGVGKTEPSKAHSTKLENLEDNTTYYYQITVKDQFTNEAKSADATFTTPIDATGPEVNEVKIDILPMGTDDETASAIISWTTNKPATTQVEYDEGVLGGKYEKRSIEDTSLNTAHTVIIKELNPSTTYHFHLVSKDKRQNKTSSQDYTFVTPTKEKSILQLIIRSLEETFSWVSQMPKFFKGLGQRITGR